MFKKEKYLLVLIILLVVFTSIIIANAQDSSSKNIKGVNSSIDKQGGCLILLECVDTPNAPVNNDAVNRVLKIIKNRLDGLGISESVIRRCGSRRILIETLKMNFEKRKKILTFIKKPALIEFKDENRETLLTGEHITDAEITFDKYNDPILAVEFDSIGAKEIKKATRNNLGRHLIIILDGEVISSHIVHEVILDGKFYISGNFDIDSARELAILLKFGTLPVQIVLLRVEALGPVVEGDSITQVSIKEEEIKTTKEKLLIDSSLYHFDHSMPEPPGYLPVSVSGPTDELALILTNPKGETDIRFISKRALIDNFETVKLRMGNAPFSRGPYILTVKTVTPEKVIYKTELWFTSPDVSIADAEFTYKITHLGGAYGYAGYYFLEMTSLTFINNGDLPAKRDTDARALITLDGKPENMTLLTRRYSISPYKIGFYPPTYIPNGKNKVPVSGNAMYGLKKGQYFVTITIPLMGGETVSFKKALTIE